MQYEIDGQLGRNGKYGGVMTGIATIGETGEKKRITVKRIDKVAPRMVQLLERLAPLKDEHIAPILDIETPSEGGIYVVRELIEGTDLKSVFTNKEIYRKVDEQKYVEAGCAVLKALSALHAVGIVHRDVKPSNVIIPHDANTNVWEADFSKAVLIDFEQCQAFPDTEGVRSSFALVYSPPEMLLKYNKLVGPWSDLFALSVMLFQLIMGKAPYSDCNPEILVNLQLTYPMKKPTRMTDELYACLSKAAHKGVFRLPPRRLTPQEIENTLQDGINGRYKTAAEMLEDLEKIETPFRKLSWTEKIFG